MRANVFVETDLVQSRVSLSMLDPESAGIGPELIYQTVGFWRVRDILVGTSRAITAHDRERRFPGANAPDPPWYRACTTWARSAGQPATRWEYFARRNK